MERFFYIIFNRSTFFKRIRTYMNYIENRKKPLVKLSDTGPYIDTLL